MKYYETLADIIATSSILIKFGHDDIMENMSLFVEFLGELGFKVDGKRINEYLFKKMVQSLTKNERSDLIEEFNIGHEPIYRKLAMVGAY